ncbi:MAG TPA: YeeE/YedE family protein [Ideonella sp.]|uniref:YeeE/YedE family protein n=1 Tax=Ideonella sp. TaxID=1929293 RepID=UPI002BD42199|nr:YeeE/YedE family protein [Ideonella sp.]HSI52211.1 YeeE/YedE family protein [Ideonella sp.]
MQQIDVPALTHQVLWATFILSVAFGALAQRSHFCTMGAVADVFHMGDWTRARMWAMAIATAMMGFGLLAGSGLIDPARALYTAPRLLWLSTLVGGAFFGFGMVLASGCGNKTLVRIGGGNLKSLVVFFVMAFAALATLRGITGVLRVNTLDKLALTLPAGQDLPALLSASFGATRQTLGLVLGLAAGALLWLWVLLKPEGRAPEAVVSGLGIGLLVAAMWWVSGHLGFVAEHPDTLEPTYLASSTRGMESFSFVNPIAAVVDWLTMYSDASKVLTMAVVMPVGVIAGSAAVALATRTFRWESFGGVEDMANHLVGALLMGTGGILALGCTVGQGLSGLSTLSVGSVLATAAIVGGAWAALHYQSWRVERMG